MQEFRNCGKEVIGEAKKMKAILIGLGMFLCIMSMAFGSGSKDPPDVKPIPVEQKMTLHIVNETGAVIEQIVFKPSGVEAYTQSVRMQKGETYTAELKKYESYAIVLIDKNGHYYGKEDCRWIYGTSKLSITEKDFISQGFWDTVKKTVGL